MKKTLLILLIFTSLQGCKYKDGPVISFRSARQRLYGQYTLVKYTINGEDSIKKMANSYGLNFYFRYDEVYDIDGLIIDGGPTECFACTYGFINHKKSIRLYDHGSFLFTGWAISDPTDADLEILKLKNDEIHLKATFNNRDYYFELTSN
jgi:hypothetical protein